MENIAIVIVNYNSSGDCKKCIRTLKQQIDVNVEFFIVDSASKEQDVKDLQEYCEQKGFNFFASNENLGYNRGNNIGLRAAAKKGYKYALVCNPDMEFPDPIFLATLVRDFDKDKEIVAVGGNIVGLDGKPQSPMKADGNWMQSFNWIKSIWNRKNDYNTYLDNPQKSHICSKLMGSCILIDLDFIQSVGFFDENVFLYCEEAILAKVIEKSDKKLYYNATTIATHAHKKHNKGNPAMLWKLWRKSRLYYYTKYSGYSAWGRFMAKLSVGIYVFSLLIAYRLRKCKHPLTNNFSQSSQNGY